MQAGEPDLRSFYPFREALQAKASRKAAHCSILQVEREAELGQEHLE